MAQQGAALQTYNLELTKGGCENAIEVETNPCGWKKPHRRWTFCSEVYLFFLLVVDNRVFYI
jgi:hypothetical protein